ATALLRCHQGQALDLSVSVLELSRAEAPGVVRMVTRLKTGGLLELAAACGALAAGAPSPGGRAPSALGVRLRGGLQMLDDLSGCVNPGRIAKATEDLRLHRPTWIWAWLAEDPDEAAYDRALVRLRAASTDEERASLAAHLRAVARAGRPRARL